MVEKRRAKFGSLLSEMGDFSRQIIIEPSLLPYQTKWANYVVNLVVSRRNETVVIEMPRQSGKNETSAQIEVRLLSQLARRGGEMVKVAPTWKPQIINSKLRASNRAESAQKRLPWLKFQSSMGYMLRCGKAGLSFLSAEPTASVVGATADVLLEVDETQDVLPDKFDKDFSPMRASRNAPLVAYGTTWDDSSLLERFKDEIDNGLVAGKIFQVYPDEVALHNPAYGEYVDREVKRLGREHPFIKTQFFLEPLATAGRMLSEAQLRSTVGSHQMAHERTSERCIVAGLDFAGGGEDIGEMVDESSGRDSVALTVASVEWQSFAVGVRVPLVRFLNRYEWVGVNPVSLHGTLYRLLKDIWKADRLHADATGIGATSTAFLKRALEKDGKERVFGQTFDGQLQTHTRLVFRYLQSINSGQVVDYQHPGSDVVTEGTRREPNIADATYHAWWQRGHAKLMSKTGGKLKAYVPDREGHDDLLVSELLCVDAAHDMEEPQYRQRPRVVEYAGNKR